MAGESLQRVEQGKILIYIFITKSLSCSVAWSHRLLLPRWPRAALSLSLVLSGSRPELTMSDSEHSAAGAGEPSKGGDQRERPFKVSGIDPERGREGKRGGERCHGASLRLLTEHNGACLIFD